MVRACLALLALALSGCAAMPPPATPTAAREAARAPVTLLVSIDGFRPDYLDRGVTPRLGALARAGVFAPMHPSFPSKTFPNHWTLVTGLRPDRTGIVGNTMHDIGRATETFTMETDDPFWWNAAEPIWVTAEKAGVRTAPEFWPGPNVAWGGPRPKRHGEPAGGTRPEDWEQFNQAITGRQRVDQVIDWLRRPAATRPKFLTLYFDTVDSAGHDGGPDAPGTTAAVADVDATIGYLLDQLGELGQPANIVIVSDHGMAATSSERAIAIDQLVPAASYTNEESGPYIGIRPVAGHEAEVAAALLRPIPHLQCWRREAIPERFHYGRNPRIAPILCLADIGWQVNRTLPARAQTGGNHGYDNMAPEMLATFIASGPAFVPGRRLPAFDNVDVAPLLRDLLRLPPGTDLDGSDAPFRGVLRR